MNCYEYWITKTTIYTTLCVYLKFRGEVFHCKSIYDVVKEENETRKQKKKTKKLKFWLLQTLWSYSHSSKAKPSMRERKWENMRLKWRMPDTDHRHTEWLRTDILKSVRFVSKIEFYITLKCGARWIKGRHLSSSMRCLHFPLAKTLPPPAYSQQHRAQTESKVSEQTTTSSLTENESTSHCANKQNLQNAQSFVNVLKCTKFKICVLSFFSGWKSEKSKYTFLGGFWINQLQSKNPQLFCSIKYLTYCVFLCFSQFNSEYCESQDSDSQWNFHSTRMCFDQLCFSFETLSILMKICVGILKRQQQQK